MTPDASPGRTGQEAGAAPAPPEEFDREQLRLLSDQLAQKVDELRLVNARLDALVEVNLRLASERDPAVLLERFCHAARDLLGARVAVVGIVNEDESPRHLVTSGLAPETATDLGPFAPRAGLPGRLLTEQRSFRMRDIHETPPALGLPANLPPFHSFLGAAVVSPYRAYGWLCLCDKLGADEFSAADEHLAAVLAAQAGRIYENSSLYADVLRHAAELDLEVGERRRAQEALQSAEALFRNLVEQSLVGIHIIQDNRFCYANPRLTEMFGYSISEVLALGSWLDLVAEEDRDFVADQVARRISGEVPATPYTFQGRRKDGSRLEIEAFSRRTEYLGRPAAILVTLDITERRRLEEQLRHAQKMEGLGRLAGGVAHDFNNLLTVILGYADLAELKLRPGDPLGQSLAEIRRACERATTLTRKLLTFSRREVVAPVVLDLNVLLHGMEDMVRRLVGEDVDIRLHADPALWRVRADVGHAEQVVMNLVVNARDAMPHGGKLTIETRNVILDEDYERSHADMPAGECVLLSVSDTGQGMDEETRARIFEPFFTTKGPEKGTGLGLATVYGIVKKAGGGVQVYSEPGLGSTFKVYLPRTAAEAPAEAPASPAPPPDRGTETVLVAEDEDGLRMLVRVVLERYGYTVLEASDGTEALRRCERHAGPIHLLATDVVMPGPSGRELLERATALRPGLKVLFLSGYTEEAIVRHGVLGAGLPFLHKPFTPDALLHKVREVLDAP